MLVRMKSQNLDDSRLLNCLAPVLFVVFVLRQFDFYDNMNFR